MWYKAEESGDVHCAELLRKLEENKNGEYQNRVILGRAENHLLTTLYENSAASQWVLYATRHVLCDWARANAVEKQRTAGDAIWSRSPDFPIS